MTNSGGDGAGTQIWPFLKGRWFNLILAAGVVGLVAGGLAGRATVSEQYAASGTVDVGRLAPGMQAGVGQVELTSEFAELAEARPVREQIAAELGVGFDVIDSGLTIDRLGNTLLMGLGFTASTAELASRTVGTAAEVVSRTMLEQQLGASRADASVARNRVLELRSQLDAISVKVGSRDVVSRFSYLQENVDSLEVQIAVTTDPDAAAALRALLEERAAERDRLAPVVDDWSSISQALANAIGADATLSNEVITLESAINELDPESVVLLSSVSPASTVPQVLRSAVGGGAVAAGIMFLLALWYRRQARDASPARRPSAGDGRVEGPPPEHDEVADALPVRRRLAAAGAGARGESGPDTPDARSRGLSLHEVDIDVGPSPQPAADGRRGRRRGGGEPSAPR